MASTSSTETTIEHLPDELLINILLHLPRNDIAKCFLVNRKWFNIINNCAALMRRVPTRLHFTQHERALNEQHRFVRNYRVLDLHGNKLHSLNKVEVINFDFIEYLQLRHCDIGSSSIFRHLLKHCKRLKYLSMECVKINQGDDGGVNAENMTARALDFLLILNYQNNLDSPLVLLKAITCERLTPKVLDFQTFTTKRENGVEKLKDILTHLHQHYAKALKNLSIFNSCDEVLHAAMDLLRLPEFKLQKLMIHELKPEFRSETFDEFLGNQTELTHFESASCLSDWHLQILLPNLTHLAISIDTFDAFNRCVHLLDKLKNLKLRAVFQEGDLRLPKNLETFQMSTFTHPSNKTRINFLLNAPMTSLKSLIISDGYIANAELEKFFKFCPNVEHLEMIGFGAEVLTLSSSIAAECSLSSWKRLRSIKLEKEYLHDDILTLIASAELKEMVWMIYQQKQLIELSQTVQQGLKHLATMCPQLDAIENMYGGIIYKRNKDSGLFEVFDPIRWYMIPQPFYIET